MDKGFLTLLFICCFLLGWFLCWVFEKLDSYKLKRLNSNYLFSDNKLGDFKFKVYKIEQTYTTGKNSNRFISKYYIKSVFATSAKNIEVNEYYFFDEVGKYNIGDELYFAKY